MRTLWLIPLQQQACQRRYAQAISIHWGSSWVFRLENPCSQLEKMHLLRKYVGGAAAKAISGFFLFQSADA